MEYDWSNWFYLNEGEKIEVMLHGYGGQIFVAKEQGIVSYRIATPKPKKEFVVGKWYLVLAVGSWEKCIALHEDGRGYCISNSNSSAYPYSKESIDWSTPARDWHP